MGSAGAGIEIADAMDAGSLPVPRAVFVAAGTCGTAAGVAVGLSARGWAIPVVAVRVTPVPYGTPSLVRRRARALERLLGTRLQTPIVGDDRYVKPGYARSNPASMEAAAIAARDGIELDPTYASKAFAALVDAARSGSRGPLLLLHTSPGPVPGGGVT